MPEDLDRGADRWRAGRLSPADERWLDERFENFCQPSIRELELTINNPYLEELEETRDIRNMHTKQSARLRSGLVELAARNDITERELIQHLSSFERPEELVKGFRSFELIQQMRLFRWCVQHEKDVVMVVHQSRRRDEDLKIWLLGADRSGIALGVLGALYLERVAAKRMTTCVCEPADRFVMSVRVRRAPIIERWVNLSEFARDFRDRIEEFANYDFNIQVNDQGKLDEALQIEGVRLPECTSQVSLTFEEKRVA